MTWLIEAEDMEAKIWGTQHKDELHIQRADYEVVREVPTMQRLSSPAPMLFKNQLYTFCVQFDDLLYIYKVK